MKKAVHVLLAVVSAGCEAPSDTSRCVLRPFHTGVCWIGEDHLYGAPHTSSEREKFVIYSFLVEDENGERALIDLGPRSLDYCNRMFRRFGFFRDLGPEVSEDERFPDDIEQPHGNVFRQLEDAGLSPSEIHHIVFTHLHADHHGIDDAKDGGSAEDFPIARLYVSKRGWMDNLARRKDGQWNSYVDYAFADFLTEREAESMVTFEDDIEVFPGLRTLYLGGHSICSQAVIVDTHDGPAILASDDIYLYRLLEERILPAVRTSEEKYRIAVERLVRLAKRENGTIVPLHDPIVWETYRKHGREWLRELKKVSDRAIARYHRGW